MTLNGVVVFILLFLPNLIALLASYVIAVEDRPIMSIKCCLPVLVLHFAITNPPCRVVSV